MFLDFNTTLYKGIQNVCVNISFYEVFFYWNLGFRCAFLWIQIVWMFFERKMQDFRLDINITGKLDWHWLIDWFVYTIERIRLKFGMEYFTFKVEFHETYGKTRKSFDKNFEQTILENRKKNFNYFWFLFHFYSLHINNFSVMR